MTDPVRIPVIVGGGQVNDRPSDPEQGLDPLGLMAAALRAADADAGGGWLADLDHLAVIDQISFRQDNPLVGKLANAIGATPRYAVQGDYPGGHTPILMLNEAANRIGSGEATVAAVAGGEALRTAAKRAAIAAGGARSDTNRRAAQRGEPTYAQRYGLVKPVDIYPLYENAGRATYGQSLAEAQAETGEIWQRFSDVAAANESAWLRKSVAAEAIITPGANNRPIAHPYLKLMVANSSVNQGAAFLVTSLAEARRRGVPEERIVYVGLGAAASESSSIMGRDRYDGSASLAVSIERALVWNGLATEELDHVELYSCFPCVPKMARRVLGWPVDRPATVFGGLTFGGGPIGNYMSHAVVEMVLRLRESGRYGLLFGNGGYATYNHSIVLSSRPIAAASFPQDFDVQAEADARRGAVPPVDEDYVGPATVESYTVFYDRDRAPTHGIVVALTPEGHRTLATVPGDDVATTAFLTDGDAEPVGTGGLIVTHGDTRIWRLSDR